MLYPAEDALPGESLPESAVEHDVNSGTPLPDWFAHPEAAAILDSAHPSRACEPPLSPEVTLDTTNTTAEENARRIVGFLREKGFLEG